MINCSRLKWSEHDVYDIVVNSPFYGGAVHCRPGVGTIIGFYIMKEAHRACRNQVDGHDNGVELLYWLLPMC